MERDHNYDPENDLHLRIIKLSDTFGAEDISDQLDCSYAQVSDVIESYHEELEDYCKDNMSDSEADAIALASIGWGTDEDYGYYGDE